MSKRTRLAALTLALALVVMAGSSFAVADEGSIRVGVATAESQFPDGIVFRLHAESADIIDEIRVFIKKADQSGRSSYRSIDVEPAETVEGETLLPASSSGDYFPPGTKISYYFEVRDKAGSLVRTEETDFVYEDNRFQWQTVSDGLITVYYYSDYVEERARIILDAAKQTMDRMVTVLGIEPTDPLRIVTYNNYRHMVTALPFRSAAASQDLQAQGMAFTDERVLLVHGFDPTVTGTTSHEFTHLLVAEAAGGTSSAIPAWLNEGLAEYGNIDKTDEYDAALRYGIYTRRIKPLRYLQTFSGEAEDIIIAYGQGKSVVSFMVGRWGEEKISELFAAVVETNDIDMALVRVYGLDQHGIDTEWRLSLGLNALPPPDELAEQLQEASSETQGEETGESESAAEPDSEQTGNEAGTTVEPGTNEASTEAESDQSAPEAESMAATEEPEAAPAGADRESGGSSSPCSAPPPGAASIGLGTLALMGTPLSLAGLPLLRRWRRKG